MKIEFYCDNGANIHSRRKEVFDTSDFGLTDEEWTETPETERDDIVREWAFERFDYGYKEIE